MHEYLLAGWGLPTGELFDLEALSILCEEEKRWDFLWPVCRCVCQAA
jgi:hypothetical protein